MAMILDPALIQACAPTVAVQTMQAIIAHESAGNPFAVYINGERRRNRSTKRCVACATRLRKVRPWIWD
jgi:type IV secretion system protein VirB1